MFPRRGLLLSALSLTAVLLVGQPQAPEKLVGPPIVVSNPESLLGGPFVVNVGPRTATIGWVVRTREALGPAPNESALRKIARSQRLVYKNLQPGTAYAYEFRGAETVRGRFKTAPTGDASFEFLVYGDTRTRHEVHQKVVDGMVKCDPDFVLHTGDLVADGTQTSQWPTFFSIEKALLAKTAFFPSIGNHERGAPQYYGFLQARPYYSFDWGAVHVTSINSDVGHVEKRDQFWAEQTRWLENDLKESRRAALRVVMFHHPPFTAVKRRGTNERTLQLTPLFEKYGVIAVFNGHDHNYQHFFRNGVHYVTTGGGGAPLYPVDAPPPEITVKVESVENFVHVQVDGTTALARAIAIDGREIDRFELK